MKDSLCREDSERKWVYNPMGTEWYMHTNMCMSERYSNCEFGIGIANLEIPYLNLGSGYGRDKLKIIF